VFILLKINQYIFLIDIGTRNGDKNGGEIQDKLKVFLEKERKVE